LRQSKSQYSRIIIADLLQIRRLEAKEINATLDTPLENPPFTFHIVFIIASPYSMLKFKCSSLFRPDSRIYPGFSCMPLVCSNAAVQTYF